VVGVAGVVAVVVGVVVVVRSVVVWLVEVWSVCVRCRGCCWVGVGVFVSAVFAGFGAAG
jgi:hypothetical protein